MKGSVKGPDFRYELKVGGGGIVIGVDEVGRGSWVGAVVAAAVSLSPAEVDWEKLGINDSKKLLPKRREELARIIKKHGDWGVGEAGVGIINRLGIVKATEKAMRAAIRELKRKTGQGKAFVLVDAFHVKYIPGVGLKGQKAIIKGDQKSISIAAASIIAKVHRDKLLSKLHQRYPKYGWKKNKGYGTKAHQKAIRKFGPTRFHRKLFLRRLQSKANVF